MQEIVDEGDRRLPAETGGVLIGYLVDEDDAVVVTEVIGPGPKAKHRRNGFEPDAAWQDFEIARLYRASRRTRTYLGDWHTHPDGAPRPSNKDHATGRRIGKCAEARMPRPFDGHRGTSECERLVDTRVSAGPAAS